MNSYGGDSDESMDFTAEEIEQCLRMADAEPQGKSHVA